MQPNLECKTPDDDSCNLFASSGSATLVFDKSSFLVMAERVSRTVESRSSAPGTLVLLYLPLIHCASVSMSCKKIAKNYSS